ncbi:hypothetical protein [Marinobacter alexandrii]|jgi:hypothetical protein|uniref:hypothetical protein n=1 Tax=Marinobacter alexandrii TaxID=2570351 RepID=UPI002ABD15D7|nr:hypothetical protein [Marinobacter alexandrii]
MSKHLQNYAAVATILVAVGTISGWVLSGYGLPFGSKAITQSSNFSPATLVVSGAGVSLRVREGVSSSPYSGGEISSSGAKQVVYLPAGQPLLIEVSGSGADIGIQPSVAPYVSINSSGAHTEVRDL